VTLNLLLAGAPKTVTDKLRRVMNAAARVMSDTRKYDCVLTHLLYAELHWLDVADLITYSVQVSAWPGVGCLCMPVAQVAERQYLCSTSRHLLIMPRLQMDTYGHHAFTVAEPMTWSLFCNDLTILI